MRRALVGLTVLVLVGGAAHAIATSSSMTVVSPGSYGTVDFGDTVRYQLDGDACTRVRPRIVVTTASPIEGTPSTPARDPLKPGSCVGLVSAPSEALVRGTGWDEGDPIDVALVAGAQRVPLRYERVQVENVTLPAGKQPTAPTVPDPRAGARDRVVSMTTGDVLGLGKVDLTHVDSISLRLCVPAPKPHVVPSLMELHQDRPDGPALLGPVDVASSYPMGDPQTKSNYGWPNCWWLQPWPIINSPLGVGAKDLFLVLKASATPVEVSYVDFNGTGAKAPEIEAADPVGMTPMPLDTGHWTMSGCTIEGDTVRNTGDTSPTGYLPQLTGGLVGPAGCAMTYTADQELHGVVVRFDVKFGSFADNGGVFVGGHEIQLRQAGEWLTGGLYGDGIGASNDYLFPDEADGVNDFSGGGYPATRLNVNSYDAWNHMEVVQLGKRHIVRLNGRTVADSDQVWPDPAPYAFGVASQPQFGYDYEASIRYDNGHMPALSSPSSWSNLVWRNFRIYRCQSPTDPVCVGGPGVTG